MVQYSGLRKFYKHMMETFTGIAGISQDSSTKSTSPVRKRIMPLTLPGRKIKITSIVADDRQYPLTLNLRYRVYRGQKPVGSGEGRTQFISPGSVLFSTRQALERGLRVELLIDWPALRDDQSSLHLFVAGSIVLTTGERALVRASHCDIRLKPQLVRVAPARAWACASSG